MTDHGCISTLCPTMNDMLGWFSDSGIVDTDAGRPKEMTAINSGVHEVPGVRLPLQTSYGSPSSHAVFMYSSTGGEGSVTLQLRDADDLDDKNGGLASVLARLQSEDATLSISYQDTEMLTEGSIDVLLGTGALHTTGNGGTTATFDLFDSESGQDLTLSPQTFTSSTEAFINDNSDSLGVPGDTDTVGSTEDNKSVADSSKLAVKKPRPKASSPNRQGPQQCQVCGKVFGNASALAKHKLTHSDERKYVCTMCGKAFKRQDHLNGHMLTHRNKKPYECKAEGCGKSYCDARSLRRHTENHHTNSNVNNTVATTTTATTTAPTVASSTITTTPGAGDDVSPALSSSCIQYAPPPTATTAKIPPPPYPTSTTTTAAATTATTTATTASKQPSQLQQLLASEPATLATSTASSTSKASSTSSSTLSNDGLTKQQLDLIHQIMQQTQQQAAAHHKQQQQQQQNSAKTSSSSSSHKASATAKPRTWNAQSSSVTGSKANGASNGGGASSSTSATPGAAAATASTTAGTLGAVKPAPDPKPVECNLCHRKFKNIPALNGHMRLHGGYFKKDSESKKCEKKESTGPPLQTASMSVRALIEEKIIQKRITNPQLATTTQNTQLSFTNTETNSVSRNPAPQQYPNLSAGIKDSDLNIKLSSFVMPAPPVCVSENKIRRHSDSEHFVPPRAPIDVQQEAVALAELLLKRSNKVAVKRASSDPGHQSPQPTQQLQLSFQVSHHPLHHYLQASPGDSYSLAGVTYQAEDGGYFSPSLQDDVLSVQDTMLLHGVDPAQLAETIQFQAASLLHDQTTAEQLQDIASLEDYQSAVQSPHFHQQGHHQDFLPVSLADFTSYAQQAIVTSASASLASPIPKDLSGYQSNNSPLQHHYSNSPHPSLTTQSPLPSPLTHHDSPGYTYPTPPASQEGQSPSFGHMVTSLPMTSPHSDSFGQTVISHGGHVAPVSSPLSAAFYTSTMSSSAAVEAALNEVLPGETMQNGCMLRNLYQPSPPPQSPLSSTPVPSPLSMSSVPASSSSVSSPLPSNSFNNNQTQMNFPLSPHLQSQMMPNSEDPLLSSSPKDFGSRKKFDFGGIHSFKLVGNGMVDFGVANAGLTGIVVDSNGELKFFQAANHQQAKNIMAANSNNCGINASIVGNGGIYHKKHEEKVFGPRLTHKTMGSHFMQNNSQKCHRSKMQITLDNMKEEADNDIFLSPTSIPASPIRGMSRKRPRPESLYIPPHPQPSYTSRLRAPRTSDTTSPPPPYTPPPMLSPARNGQGLFWQAVVAPSISLSSQAWPSSTTINKNGCGGELSSSDDVQQDGTSTFDYAPESDANPHVNVGPEYQCKIPYWSPNREKVNREPTYEHLLWDPGISKVCTDTEVEMYLEFACCAAVPGGGRNKEYALHLLHMCHGNIHEAMLKLMQPTPALHPGHPLLAYKYAESDRWSADEMDVFHQGLLKHGKDFRNISQELGSKSIKQCIQFYYLWKKVCPEEYKRLRLIRRRQVVDNITRTDFDYDDIKLEDQKHSIPVSDVELVSTSSESRLFVCEYHDCSASFNSRAALNGHIRIHGGGGCGRSPTPDKRPSALGSADGLEEFPCKICGKVFNKVKSRSAHMKSHRPPDAEPKKPKVEQNKAETSEQNGNQGRAPGPTTTIPTTTTPRQP